MALSSLDIGIIIAFFVVSLLIGLFVSKSASQSKEAFFLSGRNMPWWVLGISMVATTFAADTPGLVTDIVRRHGVAGNWVWWAFLLTGMLTVFFYARLWRRSGMTTDLEFYELRYSGKAARFLRGFRAIYLGVIFNVIVMAGVCLAAIKIGATLFGYSPIQSLLLATSITVVYSVLGGLKSILFTDVFQFVLAMVGSIWATMYIINLPEIGGLTALIEHSAVQPKTDMIPLWGDTDNLIMLLILPLTVQWWATYYPGAEPGGGGYVVQRMLSAKDEHHAVKASLFFNLAHYALRPWPWILIGLASLVMFPDLASIAKTFPNIDEKVINHDLAYSAMLTYLPTGLLGLVAASLIGAFMSTISSHLNWGASYIVNDVYNRFVNPDASDKTNVMLGRIITVVLMVLSGILSLYLESAKDAFDIIVLVGAGTGLIFILRWFWWRINAYAEIAAMVMSIVMVILMTFVIKDTWSDTTKLLTSVGVTSLAWIVMCYITPATDDGVLKSFYTKIRPYSFGWKTKLLEWNIQPITQDETAKQSLTMMVAGTLCIYLMLLSMGYLLYGNAALGTGGIAVSVVGFVMLFRRLG